jgi:putative addiction module component (TIGR02574 family)
MSKVEILAELARLSAQDRAEVQAKLDELAGDAWQDPAGELSDADRAALDSALADYEKSPDVGSAWEDVKARVQSKLR